MISKILQFYKVFLNHYRIIFSLSLNNFGNKISFPTLWFTYSCFTGFSGGAYALVAPYYVSEIAETSMRGALASLMQLMVTFGVLFVNALNIYDTVHWVTISGICIGIPGKKVFLLPNYYQFYSNAKCG